MKNISIEPLQTRSGWVNQIIENGKVIAQDINTWGTFEAAAKNTGEAYVNYMKTLK